MNLLLKLLLIVLISVQCTHCMPFLVNLCHDSETSEFCSETNDYPVKVSSDIWKKTLCEFCFLTLPIARDLIDTNRTKYFHDIAMHLCEDLKISNSIVCNMAVSEYEAVVLSIVKETELTSTDLCSLSLGCNPINNPLLNWNISLPNTPKPPVVTPKLPEPSAPKLRILQLSDIHVDFEYEPGSIANCGEPLCCRNSSTLKKGQAKLEPAFYWGDVRSCDIPLWTLEDMFDHIAKNEEFDLIYWTGDLPPHNIWNQTRNDSVSAIETLTKLFQKYFPKKSIFPTLGNHEAQPCNLFPTPYVKDDNIQWLYTSLAREWTKTGLPSYLNANITRGAFYTLKLIGNLRLISMNTNYCPKENFWLLINATDPLNQLDWLAKTLQESEDKNEKVHIIGHIHPSECLNSWSRTYYEIINRYENIIAAQIFGHDHQDSFRIFYDLKNTSRAVSVSYLGPSVTTFNNLNPGYRIYTVDGVYNDSSFNILDHETIFMNLTEANLNDNPKWEKEYSAKDAYNLKSLFPEDWNQLVEKMLEEPLGDSANKLVKFYSKSSDTYDECDLKCRQAMICGLKQSRSDNFIPCSY